MTNDAPQTMGDWVKAEFELEVSTEDDISNAIRRVERFLQVVLLHGGSQKVAITVVDVDRSCDI